MNEWLIIKSVFEQMATARENGNMPTARDEAEYAAQIEAANAETPRILSVAGGNASVDIKGVLTDAPNLFARWFGGGNTTYREVRSALAIADADPTINEITLSINSPGGSASAEWVETMEAVKNTKKPVRAIVGNMAASAAYGIASQANTIEAQNAMSSIGSVGVVQISRIRENVVEVTSSNAPKKRPDPQTKEGKKVIREGIDAIEKIFIDAIAAGRDTTAAKVKSDFGQGAVVLADEALDRNMIDSIAAPGTITETASATTQVSEKPQTQTAAGGKNRSPKMDLPTLKASHPAVFQAAFAEGQEKGVADERDRVSAHMTYGQECGCMDIAQAAIEDGSDITRSLMAKYMTAGKNKDDIEARNEDEIDASAADGAKVPAPKAEEQAATEEKVVDEALKLVGIVIEDEEVK